MSSESILLVAIMAHNEERVVSKAINSCLNQIPPFQFGVRVLVVANGCTDRTEEIVADIARQSPTRLLLMSMKEKGKTKALNNVITYVKEEIDKEANIPYVIFLDADCEFVGDNTFIKFVKRFEETPLLCAVGANCIPNTSDASRTNLVSDMYRALNELSRLLPENGISGGAYCIKSNILRKLSFPEFQMADDMYVSLKLDGWMFRDQGINVVYAIPGDLRGELTKRVRQEIATQRYFEYHRYLLETGRQTALFDTALDYEYRWLGFSNSNVFRNWYSMKNTKFKLLIALNVLIRFSAKILAYWKIRKLRRNPELDFWRVER
jgi:glycosyltransferase involved in cell wall biosynthesis